MKHLLHFSHAFLLILTLTGCYKMRPSSGGGENSIIAENRLVNAADIELPAGYKAEVIATGFTFPTDVAFDETGQVYVIEAGYSYGEEFLEPKLIHLGPDGSKATIA